MAAINGRASYFSVGSAVYNFTYNFIAYVYKSAILADVTVPSGLN